MRARLIPILMLTLSSCFYEIEKGHTNVNYKDITSEVGPEGGTIEFRDDPFDPESPKWITVTVPPGAVDHKIVIGLNGGYQDTPGRMWWNEDSTVILGCCGSHWDFEPKDIVFNKPVGVTLRFHGFENSSLAQRDPASGEWKLLNADINQQTSISTDRFTDFGQGSSIPFPDGISSHMMIDSKMYLMDDGIGAFPAFPTAYHAHVQIEKDVSHGIVKKAPWSYTRLVFAAVPQRNSLGEVKKTFDVYDSYGNADVNTDPDKVTIRTGMLCTYLPTVCDPAGDYYGLSGKVTMHRITNLETFIEDVDLLIYDNVVLKSKLTGKEITINGAVDFARWTDYVAF